MNDCSDLFYCVVVLLLPLFIVVIILQSDIALHALYFTALFQRAFMSMLTGIVSVMNFRAIHTQPAL